MVQENNYPRTGSSAGERPEAQRSLPSFPPNPQNQGEGSAPASSADVLLRLREPPATAALTYDVTANGACSWVADRPVAVALTYDVTTNGARLALRDTLCAVAVGRRGGGLGGGHRRGPPTSRDRQGDRRGDRPLARAQTPTSCGSWTLGAPAPTSSRTWTSVRTAAPSCPCPGLRTRSPVSAVAFPSTCEVRGWRAAAGACGRGEWGQRPLPAHVHNPFSLRADFEQKVVRTTFVFHKVGTAVPVAADEGPEFQGPVVSNRRRGLAPRGARGGNAGVSAEIGTQIPEREAGCLQQQRVV